METTNACIPALLISMQPMPNWRDTCLFLIAWFILLPAKLAWRVVPIRWIWRVAGSSTGNSPHGCPHPGAPAHIRSIALAVARASARTPNPTCLTRSLAAALMLRRAGLPYRLLIGVRKGDTPGDFGAHAWVVSGDKIVVGNVPDLETYTPLPVGAKLPALR